MNDKPQRIEPATAWLADLWAAALVCLVSLPLCMGIAVASGHAPQAGLITGAIGGLLVGLLSGSPSSISGPAVGLIGVSVWLTKWLHDSAVAAKVDEPELWAAGAMLVAIVIAGGFQMLFSLTRAGFLAAFFPTTVIRGLLVAVGILLILKEIPHLLGVDNDPEGDFAFRQFDRQTTFSELWNAVGHVHWGGLTVGLSSLLAVAAWWGVGGHRRWRIPALAAAGVVGTVVAAVLNRSTVAAEWVVNGNHLIQVPVGDPEGTFWRFPLLVAAWAPETWLAGILLAAVASLETLLNLEAIQRLDPRKRVTSPNRELMAQGVGNVASGLFGGLPIASGLLRGAVNLQAGGATRRVPWMHGLMFCSAILFGSSLVNQIPIAAVAAILFCVGLQLASPRTMGLMWREGWTQFIPFLVTVVAIILTDLLVGILLGLITALGVILRSSLIYPLKQVVEKHVGGEVLRIELASQISFLNRAYLQETLYKLPAGRQVLLDARNTEYIDPDVLEMIREFRDEVAPAHGVKLSFLGFRESYQRIQNVIQYVDFSSRDVQRAMTPEMVLQVLKDGNERFRTNRTLTRDFSRQVDSTSAGQFPLAVVLSCIDSRTPAEIIFDLGLGDVFSVRIAGNVARDKVLGSMEYGCAVAGAKLIVVLGHTRCGAVAAATELYQLKKSAAEQFDLPHVDALVEEIQGAVAERDVPWEWWSQPERRQACVDEIAKRNVLRTVASIPQRSRKLAELQRDNLIQIVGGLYDVNTGAIEFFTNPLISADKPRTDSHAT